MCRILGHRREQRKFTRSPPWNCVERGEWGLLALSNAPRLSTRDEMVLVPYLPEKAELPSLEGGPVLSLSKEAGGG
jgi:hypothetical protein